MTPGPTIVRACPGCFQALAERSLASGNTYGAVLWSDGRMAAPMLPDFPVLGRCPLCGTLVWLPDAVALREIDPESEEDWETAWRGVEDPAWPEEQEYLDALEDGPLSEEQEVYLHLHAWWTANDHFRVDAGIPCTPARFTEGQLANLAWLQAHMDRSCPEHRLMTAEVLREQGRFQDALAILQARPWPPKRWRPPREIRTAWGMIQKACTAEDPSLLAIAGDPDELVASL